MTLRTLFASATLALALPHGGIASTPLSVEAAGHDRETREFENKIIPMKGAGHRQATSDAAIRKRRIPAGPRLLPYAMASRPTAAGVDGVGAVQVKSGGRFRP